MVGGRLHGGGGNFTKYLINAQYMMKKWTHSDLRFCKNVGSKRSKKNEKGGQQDRKSWKHLVQIDSKQI